MNNNSLASVYAAALRPAQHSQHDAAPEQSAVPRESQSSVAASALLMTAVRRSLESCRDPAQQRMLQVFAAASRH